MSCVSGVCASTAATALSQVHQSQVQDSPHDGDGDDTAPAAPVQAQPAPGTGLSVDKTA